MMMKSYGTPEIGKTEVFVFIALISRPVYAT